MTLIFLHYWGYGITGIRIRESQLYLSVYDREQNQDCINTQETLSHIPNLSVPTILQLDLLQI